MAAATAAALVVAAGALWVAGPTESRALVGKGVVAWPPAPDSPRPRVLDDQHALNLLLVPLLDDGLPLRWSYTGSSLRCSSPTGVFVNDGPVEPGAELPGLAFDLRLELHGCGTPETVGVELTGEVDLMVFYEDDGGVSALVMPHSLKARTLDGWLSIDEPFVAFAAF